MTTTSDTKLSMKLLIDTNAGKLLFAEAEKDCVDFLFQILSLPAGTVIRLLKEKGMCGSLPNLYESKTFYGCSNNSSHSAVSNDPNAKCISCQCLISRKLMYVAPPVASGSAVSATKGFVKDVVTDDLVVKPMSTISCIALLNKFNVKDVGVLEELVVSFGMEEALELLKASLESKSVLTSVFRSHIKVEK
ncbi:hypothetical protein P3S68_013423 [Capsicum galapagoense]